MGETMIIASDFQKWLEVFNVVQRAAPTPPFSFPLIGQYGGTGVANTGKTITIGGNLRTIGAFTSDFTMTGNTAVTFPTSGTLATTASASGIVNSGLINQLSYYAAAGTTLSGLATGNDGTLITSAAGLPSISSTLPTTVQTNITRLGVIDQSFRLTPVVGGARYIILDSGGAGNTGSLNLQAGQGSAAFGGGLIMYGHSHASKPGWVTAGISSGSGGRFSVNTQGLGGGTEVATIDAAAAMVLGATGLSGTFRIPSVTAARGSFNITPVNNIADHNNVLVNAATNALRTWTLPDASGTITVLGNAVTGSGSIVLATSPTLVTPIASTTIGVGAATPSASGAGITFPATQSASTNANTLDDYEEGTWTPTIAFGGNSVGITYSLQAALYTKIGRQVNAYTYIVLSNKGSSTGAASVRGLPFSSAVDSPIAAEMRVNTISYSGIMSAYQGGGAAQFNLDQTSEAGTTTDITNTNFANNSTIMISATYSV